MRYIYIAIIVFLLFPSILFSQDFQQEKDSLQNVANVTTGEEKIMALRAIAVLPYTDYDEMFKANENLLNEAKRQGNVKAQAFGMVNELMNYFNTDRYGEYEAKADEYLQFMLSHAEGRNYYFYAYPVLLEIYIANGDYYKSLQGARQLYETAKEYDNALGIDASTYSIAFAYDKLTRYDDALRFYKLTLESQKIKEVGERSYQLKTYSDLLNLICKKDFDMSPSVLTAGWREEIIRTEREAGIDYHHWAWGDYYQSMTDYFISHGDLMNAKLYYDSIPVYNDEAKNNVLRYASKGRIAELEGNYTAAYDWFKQAEGLHLESNDEYASLDDMIRILSKMDRGREMYPLVEKWAQHIDRLNSLQHKAQLDELRTVYEVDKITAEKERNRNYMLFAFGLCTLLAILLGIWIYYNRKIAKKNKALASRIKELLAQQELRDNEILNKTSFIPFDDEREEIICPESRKDQLCIAVRDIVLKEKAYLDPMLTRDYLVERLGTNKDLFTEAFQYCFKISFPEYINSLRLKDAVILLEKSDLSIEVIAEKTGFGSVRTFQRQFKTKFNMSPKDYRNSLKK